MSTVIGSVDPCTRCLGKFILKSLGLEYFLIVRGHFIKRGHQLLQQYLLCATQSLFSCDSTNRDSSSSASSQTKGSPTSVQATCGDFTKGCPSTQVLTQGWQLLALACSLFLLKNNKILWFLKLHLSRNADSK